MIGKNHGDGGLLGRTAQDSEVADTHQPFRQDPGSGQVVHGKPLEKFHGTQAHLKLFGNIWAWGEICFFEWMA
jgi:hypothetical protein